jgi:hypothetical protein
MISFVGTPAQDRDCPGSTIRAGACRDHERDRDSKAQSEREDATLKADYP